MDNNGQKVLISIEDASNIYSIGKTRLREILRNEGSQFVILNGNKQLIKRQKFDEWILQRKAV